MSNNITVVYKWTAKPGKLEELASIYRDVIAAMQADEPDAQAAHCYVSDAENAVYVRDEFNDSAALGLHLSTTAPQHFPQLLEVAEPGQFMFFGDVPEALTQAIGQMGLAAEYSADTFGFDR